MTVNELYRSFLKELSDSHDVHEAATITSMIFEYVSGINKYALIKTPDAILPTEQINLIHESLAALKKNKPVQYITGEAWFYKIKFKVSPAVLIPRPETEELVAVVIDALKNKSGIQLIDIGTGSGCIAIAIKKNVPDVSVTAIDVSSEALIIAKQNALAEKTAIRFIQNDFLSKENQDDLGEYDIIVSNPPYIPQAEEKRMDKNVTEYEPHLALFVDDTRPLIFYERISDFSNKYLKNNGMIFLETHEKFAGKVAALFDSGAFRSEIKKDISGKKRMIIVTRCQ